MLEPILFFVLIIFGAFVLFWMIFVLDSFLYGHDLPTNRRTAKALVAAIKQYRPGAKNFYDLGCAHGDLCLWLKKELPEVEIWGVDNNAVRIFFAKLKAWLLRRDVYFKRDDIFRADLSRADVIYTYLWFDHMPPLERKLQRDLKTGAVVVTNTSHFLNWQAAQKIPTAERVCEKMPDHEVLFIYKK